MQIPQYSVYSLLVVNNISIAYYIPNDNYYLYTIEKDDLIQMLGLNKFRVTNYKIVYTFED